MLKPDSLFGNDAEEPLRGLDLYPAVFESPGDGIGAQRLRECLPSVVSLMDQLKEELRKGERPVKFSDNLVRHCTIILDLKTSLMYPSV